MEIKYLKENHPEIYKRVIEENKLQNEEDGITASLGKSLMSSFHWRISIEGFLIWNDVDNGYFDSFYNFHKSKK